MGRSSPRKPQSRLRVQLYIAASVAILAGTALGLATKVAPAAAPGETVTAQLTLCRENRQPDCVIDGDTVRIAGDRVQVADIDAPDLYRTHCPREQALAEKAAHRLLQLLNAGPIQLAPYDDRDRDYYGRKLRVLQRDGRSLGAILVNEGLAVPWTGARQSWCP